MNDNKTIALFDDEEKNITAKPAAIAQPKTKTSLIDRPGVRDLLKKKHLENHEAEVVEYLENRLKEAFEEKARELNNKKRVEQIDILKEHASFQELYPNYDVSKLPGWVIDDIKNAQIVGSSKKVVQTSDGRKYHLDNRLNHLSGAEWTYFTSSVINTRYPTTGKEAYAHKIRKVHPSPKPPQLMRDIIKFFTKEGETVLDYFMGVGGSLLGASLCDRKAVGIDLNERFIEVYKQAAKELGLTIQPTIVGDALDILQEKGGVLSEVLGETQPSLVLIDPPYGDMMSRVKTGGAIKNGNSEATPFTEKHQDLGNMTKENFFEKFILSVRLAVNHLKNNGHLVVFIKDLQPQGKELNLLHCDMINELNRIDQLYYLGTKIWADHSVNLYPYGYPYSYVSTQIHQYILIFQKRVKS